MKLDAQLIKAIEAMPLKVLVEMLRKAVEQDAANERLVMMLERENGTVPKYAA